MEDNLKQQVSEVMRLIGSIKTEKKTARARENLEAARSVPMTEERRQKQQAAQKARRERERAALGADAVPTEKRPPGRPRKPIDPDAPKRPRGRPKKQDAQTPGSSS